MTPAQVAEIFGVEPWTVRAWGDSRRLTVRRTLGGHRRYLEAEVRTLARQLTVNADAVALT
jgi:DNA-binding transcriptional MerR regulator